jgi:hypothetical protein
MISANCHPERSLAESEANRQMQSKDPALAVIAAGQARNFRVVVRFYDEQGIELFLDDSRDAAAWGSPARKCRVSREVEISPVGTAQPRPTIK